MIRVIERFFDPYVHELLKKEFYYVKLKTLKNIYEMLYGKSHIYTMMYYTEYNKYSLKNKGSSKSIIENYHTLVSTLQKMNKRNIDLCTIDLNNGGSAHKIEIYKINRLLYGTKFIKNSSKQDSAELFIAPAVIDKDDLKFVNLYVLWRKESYSKNSDLFRNFIAHLGLIKENTYIAIKNNEVYIGSYDAFFIDMKKEDSYEKIIEKIKIMPIKTYQDVITDRILHSD